jgi:hypothetical protein
MTAEIAVLNKSAVALAADSALTISAGKKEEKIYFSADKLFELSHRNPIGVMIYNGLQFMQIPLHVIISDYRAQCSAADRVVDAADRFLHHLAEVGMSAPQNVHDQAVANILLPLIEQMRDRLAARMEVWAKTAKLGDDLPKQLAVLHDEVLSVFERIFGQRPPADFIGGVPRLTSSRLALIESISGSYPATDVAIRQRVVEICKKALLRSPLSPNLTGIVIAGFGAKDAFPTLVSYEIDGLVFGKLKYRRTNFVDIDRKKDGDRARVLPFAQKEMVERFLYGLDGSIERDIATFSRQTIPEIRNRILSRIEMEEGAKKLLASEISGAETAFIKSLIDEGFEAIRSKSKSAIEEMVEFMPKPELATMAEALVNLTSIKRRVFSRGMETVGGPIDVAVISKSDGFIWVKRKHYFAPELNLRYGARIRAGAEITTEDDHGNLPVAGLPVRRNRSVHRKGAAKKPR